MCEKLPQCVTLTSIYAIYFLTFLLAGGSKLRDGVVPDWFRGQFGKSFLAKFPGVAPAYWGIALLELLIPVLVIVSLVKGEFAPASGFYFLKLAVSMASVLFVILGFGQRLVLDFVGAANSFFYFCGTLVTQLALASVV
ncbi:MAG: hypothetical protein HYR96_10030 [Deltaproteobacteria bacterium]|nr:hypothetical protein [Deltaproteobacteria bacterium]